MSSLSHEDNHQRKKEFFNRLENLIAEYPELTSIPNDDGCFDDDDFDPAAPSIITGLIIVVSTKDINDYEQLFVEKPYEQSHFHTIGMMKSALARIL